MGKYPVRTLASVCLKITDGSHFSPDMAETGYSYITVRDLNDDKIDFSNCKYVSKSDYEALKRNDCAPKYRDLLFSKDGTVGKVAIVDTNEPFVVLSSLAIITPDETQISSEFLFYVLKSPSFLQEAIGRKTGAAIRRIILKHLKSIEFPLPPVAIQKAIVAKLDAAFASIDTAIAAAEKNAENAKHLMEHYVDSIFQQVAAKHPAIKLGEMCDGVEYGSAAKSEKSGDVPVLRMGNIVDGEFNYDDLVYTSDTDEIEKYKLAAGDVLFNRTNSPLHVGKSAVFDGDMEAIFAGYLIRVKNKRKFLNSSYLNHYLNSRSVRNYGFTVMSHSVNQANINGSKLKEYPISVPEMATQIEIVRQIENLKRNCAHIGSIYSKKTRLFSALKQSLLQQAFSGQLLDA